MSTTFAEGRGSEASQHLYEAMTHRFGPLDLGSHQPLVKAVSEYGTTGRTGDEAQITVASKYVPEFAHGAAKHQPEPEPQPRLLRRHTPGEVEDEQDRDHVEHEDDAAVRGGQAEGDPGVLRVGDLEQGGRAPNVATVERVVAVFRQHGIECDVGDFLVYEEPAPETDGTLS